MIITKEEQSHITNIYYYLLYDEEKHYKECGDTKGHIFNSLKAIKRLITEKGE